MRNASPYVEKTPRGCIRKWGRCQGRLWGRNAPPPPGPPVVLLLLGVASLIWGRKEEAGIHGPSQCAVGQGLEPKSSCSQSLGFNLYSARHWEVGS